jgi:hypothetical protein
MLKAIGEKGSKEGSPRGSRIDAMTNTERGRGGVRRGEGVIRLPAWLSPRPK